MFIRIRTITVMVTNEDLNGLIMITGVIIHLQENQGLERITIMVISVRHLSKWSEDRRPGNNLSNSPAASLNEEIMATGVVYNPMEVTMEITEGEAGLGFK
jgi:hypothetical protein